MMFINHFSHNNQNTFFLGITFLFVKINGLFSFSAWHGKIQES